MMSIEDKKPDAEPLGPVDPKPAEGAPDGIADKAQKLADDAVEAGRKFAESETGRKVVEATDTAFAKAEELGRKAMDSDLGRDASETAKRIWNTPVGRNVGIGAAAGAGLGLVIPFVGPIIGAVVGGGLGYLRTLSRKG
jgi:hypothetical protein